MSGYINGLKEDYVPFYNYNKKYHLVLLLKTIKPGNIICIILCYYMSQVLFMYCDIILNQAHASPAAGQHAPGFLK